MEQQCVFAGVIEWCARTVFCVYFRIKKKNTEKRKKNWCISTSALISFSEFACVVVVRAISCSSVFRRLIKSMSRIFHSFDISVCCYWKPFIINECIARISQGQCEWTKSSILSNPLSFHFIPSIQLSLYRSRRHWHINLWKSFLFS